jgi:hypothetical protein
MKNTKSIFTSVILILMVSVSLIAQPEPKVVAIVNSADWCSVCEANGERAMATFMKNNKDGAILFVSNNLTNDQTKKKSAVALKSCDMEETAKKVQGTGLVSFYNPKTKALIGQVSVSEPDNKLAEAMVAAKNHVK